MSDRIDTPLFVREALEGQAAAELRLAAFELADQLATLVEPVAPSAQLLQRLELALGSPAQRYAPFCGRVAELFDLPEAAAEVQLARLSEPSSWRFAGLPGIAHISVEAGPRARGAETLFVRFAPGTYFPRHLHLGVERALVLEGEYTDDGGIRHAQGELRQWAALTQHSFRVSPERDCVLASVVFGRRFAAWPLRALSRLLGR